MYKVENDKSKLVNYANYKLCYISKVPETIFDYSEETKHYMATDPEYLTMEKWRREKMEKQLKEEGHATWISHPLDHKTRMEEFPNPELKNGKYIAYFTPLPLNEQWGDDWDDAPYEHNAGDPYDTKIISTKDVNGFKVVDKQEEYTILEVYFTPKHFITLPKDYGFGGNSPFCIKDINNGAVAWIYNGKESIHAGINPIDFIEKIKTF